LIIALLVEPELGLNMMYCKYNFKTKSEFLSC
jgi:hypothetical protein